MLNVFLLAALAFGVLGLLSLIWSPATDNGGASAVQVQAPSVGAVRLVPKNPQAAAPDRLGPYRGIVAAEEVLRSIGKTTEQISEILSPVNEAALAKLLEAATDEA